MNRVRQTEMADYADAEYVDFMMQKECQVSACVDDVTRLYQSHANHVSTSEAFLYAR